MEFLSASTGKLEEYKKAQGVNNYQTTCYRIVPTAIDHLQIKPDKLLILKPIVCIHRSLSFSLSVLH